MIWQYYIMLYFLITIGTFTPYIISTIQKTPYPHLQVRNFVEYYLYYRNNLCFILLTK